MDMETETDRKRKWTLKRKWKLTIHGHGHGIGELLLSISYGAIVPIARYGMPLKSRRNFQWRYILVAPLHNENNDMKILKIHTAVGISF
jgi:hypothetical protein